MPRDENASAMAEYLSRIPHVSISMSWEPSPFTVDQKFLNEFVILIHYKGHAASGCSL